MSNCPNGCPFALNKSEVIGISGKVTVFVPKVNEKLGLGNIFKFNYHEHKTCFNYSTAQFLFECH